MKNIIMILFVALSSTFIGSSMYAQCPAPKDCPGDPFNGPFYRTIPLSPTCSLRYEYCWRTALCVGGLMDTYIGDLELVGDCDDFKDDIITNLNTYLQYCHDDVVLNENPWEWDKNNFPECCPPSDPPCWTDWFWRQGNYACYTEWYWDTVKQAWVLTECDVENPGSYAGIKQGIVGTWNKDHQDHQLRNITGILIIGKELISVLLLEVQTVTWNAIHHAIINFT